MVFNMLYYAVPSISTFFSADSDSVLLECFISYFFIFRVSLVVDLLFCRNSVTLCSLVDDEF